MWAAHSVRADLPHVWHLAEEKKLRWHIDSLRAAASPREIWIGRNDPDTDGMRLHGT